MTNEKFKMQKDEQGYGENAPMLPATEHVRMRPAMHFGGTDKRALYSAIMEPVMELVRTHAYVALRARSTMISLILNGNNSITVNGVGLSIFDPLELLERIMTSVFVPGSGGVGLFAVNALSEWMIVEVGFERKLYRQSYAAGYPKTPVEEVRDLADGEAGGTTFTFLPDATIFTELDVEHETLQQRFLELAFLIPQLTLELRDERSNPVKEETFHHPNGLNDFVRYLKGRHHSGNLLHEIVHVTKEMEVKLEIGKPHNIEIDFAFQFSDDDTVTEWAYGNMVRAPDGGTHLRGLLAGICPPIWQFGVTHKLYDRYRIAPKEIRHGLTAVINVKHPRLSYRGSLRNAVANPELEELVDDLARAEVQKLINQNPDMIRELIERAIVRKHKG